MRESAVVGFEDSSATEYLLEIVDRAFDILNSSSPSHSGYKAPICQSNFVEIEKYLLLVTTLFSVIETPERKRIVKTRKSTGFVGLMLSTSSFLGISESLIREGFKYVLSYKFSQDHLELFFNSVRRSCGWNDNPTCLQFRNIYRRLLKHVGVECTSTGNCIVREVECEDVFDCEDIDLHVISPFVENVLSYVSGFVVRKVLCRLDCVECRLSLVATSSLVTSSDSCHFLRLKNNGGLMLPSSDVLTVIKITEQCFRTLSLREVNINKILYCVFRELEFKQIFASNHFADGHFYSLIKLLVETFVNLRHHHSCKLVNDKKNSRFVLHKNIHFQNN